MYSILIIVHVIICLSLMLVVLMQSAKGEGLAGAFGGGGLSGAVFGGRGAATFLSKATTALAVLFMFSCIGLTLLSRGSAASDVGTSAVQRIATEQQQQLPPSTTPVQTQQQGQQSTEMPAAPRGDSGK